MQIVRVVLALLSRELNGHAAQPVRTDLTRRVSWEKQIT